MQRRIQDYLVAGAAIAACHVLLRLMENFGHFYYLPMVPGVMVTAIVTNRRGPTLLAVALAVATNVMRVQREGPTDIIANALLFAGVCWLVSEMCWRLDKVRARAADLSERLSQHNQMLDAVLAATPVVAVDRGGRIQLMTPPACAMLGVCEREGVGRLFTDLVPGFECATNADGAGGEGGWMARRSGNDGYPLRIKVGLVAGAAADGPYATLSLTDLTQTYVADARARDLNLQLNRVWRLNSLGEMAASLAHELNQPLSAAANYLHASQVVTQKADVIGRSATQTIELAKNQLLRAGAIIRRMRELLAHESHSLAAERVSEMVADIHGVVGMIGRNAGVRIDYQIEDVDDGVRAQRIQFQQAMINLIRNAVEALHGRDDGLVRVVGRVASDDHYEVRVEDNGPGVGSEQIETVFRPLTTTKSAGMGLGLSVTRTIVESHGGALTVGRSDLGGAVFAFSLLRDSDLEEV